MNIAERLGVPTLFLLLLTVGAWKLGSRLVDKVGDGAAGWFKAQTKLMEEVTDKIIPLPDGISSLGKRHDGLADSVGSALQCLGALDTKHTLLQKWLDVIETRQEEILESIPPYKEERK